MKPSSYMVIYDLIMAGLLVYVFAVAGNPPYAVALSVYLFGSAVFRMRIRFYTAHLFVDAFLTGIVTFFWPYAAFGYLMLLPGFVRETLWLPFSLLLAHGLFVLPGAMRPLFLFIMALAFLFAFAAKSGEQAEAELISELDKERQKNQKAEEARLLAQKSFMDVSHMALIAERHRIAQAIHDNVGHEIAGALISLKTAQKLYDMQDARAGDMLFRTIERLEGASVHLRETVHNVRPAELPGLDDLYKTVEGFLFCPVSMQLHGDFSLLSPVVFDALLACVKEGLTNVQKHSNAKNVHVVISLENGNLQLIMKDDGQNRDAARIVEGLGIAGIKNRAKAFHGRAEAQKTGEGFLLTVTIPAYREGEA